MRRSEIVLGASCGSFVSKADGSPLIEGEDVGFLERPVDSSESIEESLEKLKQLKKKFPLVALICHLSDPGVLHDMRDKEKAGSNLLWQRNLLSAEAKQHRPGGYTKGVDTYGTAYVIMYGVNDLIQNPTYRFNKTKGAINKDTQRELKKRHPELKNLDDETQWIDRTPPKSDEHESVRLNSA